MTTSLTEQMAETLRRRVRLLGLTHAEIAERAGCFPSHVGHLLNGNRQGSPSSWEALAAALGLSFEVVAVPLTPTPVRSACPSCGSEAWVGTEFSERDEHRECVECQTIYPAPALGPGPSWLAALVAALDGYTEAVRDVVHHQHLGISTDPAPLDEDAARSRLLDAIAEAVDR